MFLKNKNEKKEVKVKKEESFEDVKVKKEDIEEEDKEEDEEEENYPKRNRDNTDLKNLESNLTSLLFDDEELIERLPKKVKKEEIILKEAWKDNHLDTLTIDELKGSEYEEQLRKKFLLLNPYPKWALNTPKEMNELFSTTEKMIESSTVGIDFKKISDVTDQKIAGRITSLSFHPNANIIQVSDQKQVRLFQVDGNNNLLLEKYDIKEPILSNFISDKELVVIRDKINGFSLIDIVKGNIRSVNEKVQYKSFSQSDNLLAFGSNSTSIQLFSRKTKFKIGEVKMNVPVNRISFSKDSNHLYGVGESSIYIWDVRNNNRPISIHQDVGSLNTLGLALCSKYYATGDKSGVVNLYKTEAKTPFKVLMNLVTAVDVMEFSHDETVLAYGSSKKENTLRILNLNSYKVTPLKSKIVDDLSFSFQDDYLSVASKSRANLYKKC